MGGGVVDAAPFAAVRYNPHVAGDAAATSAPSYDDVGPLTYARHRAASPYTVLELLAGGPEDAGYASAGAALARWRRTGVLVREPAPAFYRYEEHELRHGVPAVQRGLLAAVRVEPLSPSAAVLPHEAVDPARVGDRLDRLAAVPVDVAPVFALHRDPGVAALLDVDVDEPPVVAASDDDGTDHRIWALRDPERITALRHALADVRAVIADGHHRYATALAFAERQRAAGGDDRDGRAPWARTLVYLVDAEEHGPRVCPIHRLLRGLPRGGADRLAGWVLEPLRPGAGTIDPAARAEALATAVATRADGAVGLLMPGAPPALLRPADPAALGRRLTPGRSTAWRALPAALCDELLIPALSPAAILHRSDPAAAAAELGDDPSGALLLLPPIPASTVLDLAEAGELLPPKTTSFRPKPRTGLLLREVLDEAEEAQALARLEDGDPSAP
jgi:uncharacterized protein (DUF1015 family)